ncbi:asparagine synthase (glutamine-hydrolyzing) [Streptomyces canus]|uniref:asparagine synthase (glutamine-hydrolyzing) n=1 Tax=Streptomyces canus TaxID=58343 RepID=A0AAW8FGQ2_9ACTN|nr:asparagine synthase (glutamine-hydrolyzing) [Streptomyces canus]MDQ0762609.1 asparagine synthase (glutamine-hydrolyzing) [Streptomyces canus]MDQ0908919.1 asparagine synthase (glutamine-hydrolyzing) [Streptomyces canus]MDQ1068947.1 asparagine synthase (glutamine-hydrolyzing) [Streptomyces canus]
MSAVAGWVDHRRDLSTRVSVVTAMARTMVNRGPEGEHVWSSPYAVLAGRGRAAEGVGGAQFAVIGSEGRRIVVSLAGRLDNRRGVSQELGLGDHGAADLPVAELVGRAFLRWGPGCAEHLEGMFAFALWDERRQELFMARDRLGTRALFYYPTPTGVLFASERKALLAHPEVTAAVDADGLRELISHAGTPGAAVFRGMRQVPSGCVVRFGPDGERTERYWALRSGEHGDDLATTVRTVRSLLEDAVARQIDTAVPTAVLLSGGLDSSAISALAAGALRRRGAGPLRAFTVGFADQAEHFRADEVWNTPDDPFVADVARHVGAELTPLVLDTGRLLDPAARQAALHARDLPSCLGHTNTSLYLVCRAAAGHTPAALHGDPADAVFGGFTWAYKPELLNARTLPWVARAASGGGRAGMGGDLLDEQLLKELDIPGYSAARHSEAVAEVAPVAGESERDRRLREISYLHLTRWPETLIGHSEALSTAAGLQLRWPFADHRLIEYVYNTPWSMKSFDGREKSLLRAAAMDVLPESVVNRTKSPFPVIQDEAYGRALCREMTELVNDPSAPAAEVLNADAVRALVADPSSLASGPRAWVARAGAEMLLQLNTWLQTYRVRLEL